MARLSEHFKSKEFACKGKGCCGGVSTVSMRLVESLETLRALLAAANDGNALPINILSGRRCVKHNTAVGGAANSQHLMGRAADIFVDGVSPGALAEIAEKIYAFRVGGIGVYSAFVHLDVRKGGAKRWTG